MTDRTLLLAFSFHMDLAGAHAPLVLAWPWEHRRRLTAAVLGAELAVRLRPRPGFGGPHVRAEDVTRILGFVPVNDATIERVVSLLEKDLRLPSGSDDVLAPGQPRFLYRALKSEGAVLAFQVLEVAP